jgi:hypothetical protein
MIPGTHAISAPQKARQPSPKGMAAAAPYRQSAKGKMTAAKYRSSASGKAVRARYKAKKRAERRAPDPSQSN